MANQKLVEKVKLRLPDETISLAVEYEWMPEKCVKCQVFGHRTELCGKTDEKVRRGRMWWGEGNYQRRETTRIDGGGIRILQRGKEKISGEPSDAVAVQPVVDGGKIWKPINKVVPAGEGGSQNRNDKLSVEKSGERLIQFPITVEEIMEVNPLEYSTKFPTILEGVNYGKSPVGNPVMGGIKSGNFVRLKSEARGSCLEIGDDSGSGSGSGQLSGGSPNATPVQVNSVQSGSLVESGGRTSSGKWGSWADMVEEDNSSGGEMPRAAIGDGRAGREKSEREGVGSGVVREVKLGTARRESEVGDGVERVERKHDVEGGVVLGEIMNLEKIEKDEGGQDGKSKGHQVVEDVGLEGEAKAREKAEGDRVGKEDDDDVEHNDDEDGEWTPVKPKRRGGGRHSNVNQGRGGHVELLPTRKSTRKIISTAYKYQ